jgi:XisH protein
MSRQDAYHDAVRRALEKDGWTITHDPLTLSVGGRDLYVDLGAEQPIAAEKQGRKIAVEVKSFLGPSPVRDLEEAIGQFVFYRNLLQTQDPERRLYLAIRIGTFRGIFSEPVGQLGAGPIRIPLLVFSPEEEVVERWVEPGNTPPSSGG